MVAIFEKTKKDLCVGQLLNGMIVVGEAPNPNSNEFKKGEVIKNPVQIEIVPDPNGKGFGFKSSIVGEQFISKKAISLDGIPVIQTFELYPLPVEMFISLHKLDVIFHGEAFMQVYNELMTKMPEPINPADLLKEKAAHDTEDRKLKIVQ